MVKQVSDHPNHKVKSAGKWSRSPHSDEVQEMLDFEVEGKQYEIQCHYFTNRKLHLVVNDRIMKCKQQQMWSIISVIFFIYSLPIFIVKSYMELVAKLGWIGLTNSSNKLEGFSVG